MIIAIDFDGTIAEHKFPEIGKPIPCMKQIIKELKEDGHELILWTCRVGEKLEEAKQWLKENGLLECFDAFNENLPRLTECFGNDTRKIFANLYVDDSAIEAVQFIANRWTYGRLGGKEEERTLVANCESCHRGIYEGEEYYHDLEGVTWHKECPLD